MQHRSTHSNDVHGLRLVQTACVTRQSLAVSNIRAPAVAVAMSKLEEAASAEVKDTRGEMASDSEKDTVQLQAHPLTPNLARGHTTPATSVDSSTTFC